MFLRRCLLTALLAAVPVFSAIGTAIGDTQRLPRQLGTPTRQLGTPNVCRVLPLPIRVVVRDTCQVIRDTHGSSQLFGTPTVRRGVIADAVAVVRDTQGLLGAGGIRDSQDLSRHVAVPGQFGGQFETPTVRRSAMVNGTIGGTIGDTHGLLRRAARPTAGTPASFAGGLSAARRLDPRHDGLPAAAHTARSAEISQSVIRNAAVEVHSGFGAGEKRGPLSPGRMPSPALA